MSGWALDPRTMSFDDIAAYTIVLLATVATLGALWLLGRCTLRTCVLWGLAVVLVPVSFAGCGEAYDDPDPCDPGCAPTECGETGACNGE